MTTRHIRLDELTKEEIEKRNAAMATFLGYIYHDEIEIWEKPSGGFVLDGLWFDSDYNCMMLVFEKLLEDGYYFETNNQNVIIKKPIPNQAWHLIVSAFDNTYRKALYLALSEFCIIQNELNESKKV